MSGSRSLTLALAPSRNFAAAILAMHATAAVCFLTILTGWLGVSLAILTTLLGAAAGWDRALLRGRRSPSAIELRPSGEATLRLRDGATGALRAFPGIGVTRHWVALGTALPWRRNLLVVAGMLGEEEFRTLRLWALWGRIPGVAPGQLPA